MAYFDTFEHTQYTLFRLIKGLVGGCYKLNMPNKVREIRKKDKIKVLFVLSELSPWKTEALYQQMLEHPRFEPVIGVAGSPEEPEYRKPLEDYLKQKQIAFLRINGTIVSQEIKPDVIFYQKPYYWAYTDDLKFDRHWNALFCYVGYAFNTMEIDWAVNNALYKYAWQIYFENESAAKSRRLAAKNYGKNIVVTGMPIQDKLLTPKEEYQNPWKPCGDKLKIIYAPHHTIGDMFFEGINFSTFLENADAMLEMAIKYQDKVQWAFKPHPMLYPKLLNIWGEERTNAYYNKWATLPNTQLENGKYEALFKYSNAMIHDCSSFTIEYLYINKPVLYLTKDKHHADNLNEFASKAFDMHYKAQTNEEIERFITDVVIGGNDTMSEQRKAFYNSNLITPNQKSACQNIINAILGVEEYKD